MNIQSLKNSYQSNLPDFEILIYRLENENENDLEVNNELVFTSKVSNQLELSFIDLNLSEEVPFFYSSKVIGYFFFFNNTWNYANQYQINYLDSVGDLTFNKDLIVKDVIDNAWIQNVSGQKFKFITKSTNN